MITAWRAAALLAAATAALAQPIQLHPRNPHYFLYRGKATALVTSGEHYGAVINADFDFRRYLATIEGDGLNMTRIFGGSYREVPEKSFGIKRNPLAPAPGRFIAPWARSEAPGYAGGGNKFDLARWNPEYFERYREFLSEAAKRGIVVEITFFSSHYQEMQWDLSPFHPNNNVNGTGAIDWKKLHTVENGNILEHQERYVRKLVREANGFDNVFFEIQNEPWSDRTVLADTVNPYLSEKIRNVYPNSIDVADELSMAWQARVAGWITSEESALPKKHLIAQNYSNFRAPVRNLAPGVSIVNFHYAYPEVALLNRGLGKVIAYDETGFLGQNDEGYRRQAWNFMLSGGGMFDALDYSFSPGKEDGTDTAPNGPGGGSPAFRKQLRVLSEFLQKLPLEQMQPEFQAVKHSGGAYARALASSAGDYAIYFDGSAPLDVTLNLPSGNYAGEWVDPASGQPAKAEKFTHAGGDKALAAPAFQNGIALRLKRTPR